MSKTLKYVLLGVGALVLFELFKGGSLFGATATTGYQSANPYAANYVAPGSTAQSVAVGITAGTGLLATIGNLFSGRTTAPLTSGASPSNPNDLTNTASVDYSSGSDLASSFFGLS